MKVVTAYRPFAPESVAHQRLGPFDWPDAIRMLRASVQRSCGCPTVALTDVATRLDGPVHRYDTRESRLMLWLLEVWSRYLDSPDFDQDTVMISPDALVYEDLRSWFRADLGVVVRLGKFARTRPLLNGVQFWSKAAQPRLVAFYQQARAIAETLPASAIRWGADTIPLVRLLDPLVAGGSTRAGLSVYGIPHHRIFRGILDDDQRRLDAGRSPMRPDMPIIDFKYLRKRYMGRYFAATVRPGVSA